MTAEGGWTVGEDLRLRKGTELRVLLGGQVHNSSSSSAAAIRESFAHAQRVNANTVLAPVSWALTEPREGVFDFALVDAMLEEAARLELNLVLLWFGAFKNATSTYAPRWVRADQERFPRAVVHPTTKGSAFHYSGVTPTPVLSVFSEALCAADGTAFEALMRHLVESDESDVVALVQVENESGLLRDSRDRSDPAASAWAEGVPDALIAAAREGDEASLMHCLWVERGRRDGGTWSEVFGDSADADEVFMAWAIASYVERVAARGQAAKRIPMYANAWLGPQPGQEEPGQWPSGGPSSRVIDVWRVAAPSLALVGPDIYVDDADSAMRDYATGTQPFFVPESRLRAGELVRAIGTHRAIGWSGFGIDGANPDGQVAATFAYLTAFEHEIARAQQQGRIGAVVVEPGTEVTEAPVGDLTVSARSLNDIVRNFLLDVGVQLPDEALPVPDETLPREPVPTPGETRPFALVFAEDDDSWIVVGQGVKLDFTADDRVVEYDSVVELLLGEDGIVPGRVLNGDERLQVVPVDRVGAARITLLRMAGGTHGSE
ncbi:DUF5597 domain-containing protein [Microbacterium sp. 4R-513]|uniref:DUF5597 domain-containing protein n=1 Tax=Microbacterium sp. 4R-513 TaxID=2567934 RepID=UPI0013E15BF8|nr:DUF5597 domain-containing protein [Microbacterium sp. 4R-513]QIG39175.1 DUF5597 domain-containing protein [Microbacterium sp. 4R-513]